MLQGTSNKRIKIIMIVNKLDVTGISTVVMNYCSHINLSRFSITVAAGEPVADIHRNCCQQLGIELYLLPNRKRNSSRYYKELNSILKENHFDILHVHGNSATMAIELFLGQINGVKIRISHSHNTTCTNMALHKILYPIFIHLYTHAFACGKKAGEWLYGDKPFYIISNGFDTKRFKFSQEARENIRKEIGFEDAFIIGHMGRFNEQKNQPFLIKVFEQFAAKRVDSVLLLVGTGPDFKMTKEIAEASPYSERIVLYGETNTPEDFYSAMDVFILPSKYEGLPVVLVEAECNGLYCIVSDLVTDEMNIDHHIVLCSLDGPLHSWCEAIDSVPKIDRKTFYLKYYKDIERYNIDGNVKYLEKLYMNFIYGIWRE